MTKTEIRKQLANFDYVNRLTVLTPIERDILTRKYRRPIDKQFGLGLSKIQNTDNARSAFNRALIKIERCITDNNITNARVNTSLYYRGYLLLTGYLPITDQDLIKRHKNIIGEKKRRAEELAKWRRVTTNVVVSSKIEARKAITRLKTKYKI